MKWATISIQGLLMLAMPALDVRAVRFALGCVKRCGGIFRSSKLARRFGRLHKLLHGRGSMALGDALTPDKS